MLPTAWRGEVFWTLSLLESANFLESKENLHIPPNIPRLIPNEWKMLRSGVVSTENFINNWNYFRKVNYFILLWFFCAITFYLNSLLKGIQMLFYFHNVLVINFTLFSHKSLRLNNANSLSFKTSDKIVKKLAAIEKRVYTWLVNKILRYLHVSRNIWYDQLFLPNTSDNAYMEPNKELCFSIKV